MDRVAARLRHISVYVVVLVKWIAVGSLIGIVGGAAGTLFHLGVDAVTGVREGHPWVLYLLPLGGLAIVWLYRAAGVEGKGTNAVIESVHFGSDVPIVLVPVIFLATIVTHLFGGSAGREGAALQIGGGIGYEAGTLMGLGEKDLPLATLCGMSAVFAALFGTPLTACIFALEVISVGVLYYAGLIPCITAALVGYKVSLLAGVNPESFTVPMPDLALVTMLRVLGLAVLCAVISIVFVRGLHYVERQAAHYLTNPYVRVLCGAAAVIGLTLLLGTRDYNGTGMEVIARAMAGEAASLAWFWKILFTALTIGCGFKGGEVVPSFFVGAVFGCVAGPLLGLPAPMSAAIGLVAVFCGAVNCPIASVILSVELFGAGGMLYFAVACAISYLLSGYCGLYSSQTILYSKLRAEFINVHAKE
jgi:H+/Cl- antiporter ClcA